MTDRRPAASAATRSPGNASPRDDEASILQQIRDTIQRLEDDKPNRGDLKLISRSLREMRRSFNLLAKYRSRKKITVFGSARTPMNTPLYEHAVAFGRSAAAKGYMIITGGGPGIMQAGHVGAGADLSMGFNIVLPFEQEANLVIAGNEKLINFNYFFTRKLMFLKDTSALVLYPGGFGTLDEGFECLTLIQTGKSPIIPVIMVDEPGGDYWRQFEAYIRSCLLHRGMISPEDMHLFSVTHAVDEVINEIEQFYRIYHSQRFVRGELVLRLHEPLTTAMFDRVCDEYSDILACGRFRQGPAHDDEANEPDIAHLHRLYIPFNRKSHGRLRQLINLINQQPPAPTDEEAT